LAREQELFHEFGEFCEFSKFGEIRKFRKIRNSMSTVIAAQGLAAQSVIRQ